MSFENSSDDVDTTVHAPQRGGLTVSDQSEENSCHSGLIEQPSPQVKITGLADRVVPPRVCSWDLSISAGYVRNGVESGGLG